MCKVLGEGGRCAGGSKRALDAASRRVQKAVAKGDMQQLVEAKDMWSEAAAHYAATDEGEKYLTGIKEQKAAEGDLHTEIVLGNAIREGQKLRAENEEIKAILAAAKAVSGDDPDPDGPLTAIRREDTPPPPQQPASGALPAITAAQQELLNDYNTRFTPLYDKYGDYKAKVGEHSTYAQERERFARYLTTEKKNLDRLQARTEDPASTDTDIAHAIQKSGNSDQSLTAPNFLTREEAEDFYAIKYQESDQVADVHVGRALAHPNAGPQTVQAALNRNPTRSTNNDILNKALRHPSCTPIILAGRLRRATHGIDERTWAHARTLRASNPAVATACALNDPNDAEKQQAYRYLLETPAEDFSADDRRALMSGLGKLQTGGHGQRNLVGNFMTWTEVHGDDEDRKFFGETFRESRWTDVSDKAREFLGEPADTENGGGWLRRRRSA